MRTTYPLRALILSVLTALVVLVPVSLFGADEARAEYGGSRWGHADRAVCVTIKNIKTTAVRDAVKRSVARWNGNTVLDVRVRNDCYALGYSQRIVVYDRHYDRKSSGWVEFKGGYEWHQADTAGSWTVGDGWTYAHRSPVIVRINRTYTDGSYNWRQRVVSHELGHALGLGHNPECKSVVNTKSRSDACGFQYKYGGWWDWTGTASNPGIGQIYKKG